MMKEKTKFKETEIGIIPEEWDIASVSDLAEIYIGGTPKTEVEDYWNGEIKWATAKDVSNCTSRYIHNTERTITKAGIENSNAKLFPKETLVITSRGTVGKLALLGESMSFNQTCYGLIAKKHVLPLFLYYKLLESIDKILSASYGTIFDTITTKTFDELKLQIPPLHEQRSIVRILSDLDSKIELNQQMNKTLEEIARAIFKHWFIDFEFPNEEGKPYKSSGGEMVYNELLEKEIPAGWNVDVFSKLVEVNPKRELAKGSMARKISMADLNPWQSWIQNWSIEEYKAGPKFKNGDILFARITPSLENGKTAFVSILEDGEVGFGSTEFIIFSKKIISSPLYIYHLSRSEQIRSAAISAMSGTSGRQRVPDELFDHLNIFSPPDAIIQSFERLCSSMFNRITVNAEEIRILSQIRDSLLPRLMSGKIRVPVEAQ